MIFIFSQTFNCATISLLLKPAPEKAKVKVEKELSKLDKKNPAQIGKKLLKNGFRQFLPKISGFPALYGGYVDYSDNDGSLQFPLLHSKSKVYLVITPEIELFTIDGNTISHRKFVADKPAEIYLFERKDEALDKDKKEKTLYWKVSKVEKPADNSISPKSIVILTKPKNLFVPTGDFITEQNANLILPSVYVVGDGTNIKALLNFLDIRRFFEQIDRQYKLEKDKTVKKIMKNI